jgi:phospholipid/cholesterol/gamma-HCH transport system substrate-binding protein
METRAHHVLIGAFVLIVSALLVLSLFWAGKHSMEREFTYYDVYFREAVTGLAKGSPVQYNGIQVGEVTALRLSRIDPNRVIARIRVGGSTPIKIDTQAKMGYLGLTGVGFIQLSGGTGGASPLVPRPGRTVAVIRAQPSALSKLFDSGTDIVTTVNDVLNRVARILSDENAAKLSQAIDDLNRLSSVVGTEAGSVQTILRDGARATSELADTLAQVRMTVQRLENTIGNADRILDQDVAKAMSSLRDASVQIQGILGENRGAIDQFAQEGLVELGQALAELRSLLASIQNLSDRLESNPSGFLLGRDQPKEYVP